MARQAMSNINNNNVMPQAEKSKSSEMQEYNSNDSTCNPMHAEYSVPASMPPTAPMYHGAPHHSYYGGQNSVGYGETERYAGGCQRLVPTITLTSHRIQFGCQPNQPVPPPYGAQRYEEPNSRHPYFPYPPQPPGKSWSEVAVPEHPPAASKSNNRGRTTYTDDQLAELESVFNRNPYPTNQTRQHLAYKIDVPEVKVKIWFQNRRARAKKYKMGCSGGGAWRVPVNESRSSEEQGNRNNNNLNNDFNKSTDSFSVNTLLPLPTKPTLNSQLYPWSNSSSLTQKSQEGVACDMRPSQTSSSTNYHCTKASVTSGPTTAPTTRDYERKYKAWNWGSHPSVPQHFPTVQRQSQSTELPANVGIKQYTRSAPVYERSFGSSWQHSGQTGNVPDLITQTSRVGISDTGTMDDTENNKSAIQDAEHISNLPRSSRETDVAPESISKDAGNNLEPSDLSKTSQSQDPPSSSSCPIVPPTTSTPPYFAPISYERKLQICPSSMKSPPPIRRLVFPFHTLTDARPSRPEYGFPRGLGYQATIQRQDSSAMYGRTFPSSSGMLGQERNIHVARMQDSLPSYSGYINTLSEDREKYPRSAENGAYQGGWSLGYSTASSGQPSGTNFQGNVKYLASTQVQHNISSQSDPLHEDEEIDDGDVTDDAVEDVRGMEGVKQEDCDQSQKPGFSYTGGNYTHYLTGCWGGQAGTSSMVKADYEPEEGSETGQNSGQAVERLTNLTSDVITPVESSAVWTNQLMTGIYPPSSASLVG